MVHTVYCTSEKFERLEFRELDSIYCHNEVDYQKGEIVLIKELNGDNGKQTGRELMRQIIEVHERNFCGNSSNEIILKVQ